MFHVEHGISERLKCILGQLPHKHKLVIAGNHELSFDNTFTHPFQNISGGSESKDRRLHTGKKNSNPAIWGH